MVTPALSTIRHSERPREAGSPRNPTSGRGTQRDMVRAPCAESISAPARKAATRRGPAAVARLILRAYIDLRGRIGRYEIVREIGRARWRSFIPFAQDPHVRRRVAVKTFLLPQGLARSRKPSNRSAFSEKPRPRASSPTRDRHDLRRRIGSRSRRPVHRHGRTSRGRAPGSFSPEGAAPAEQVFAMADVLADALGGRRTRRGSSTGTSSPRTSLVRRPRRPPSRS